MALTLLLGSVRAARRVEISERPADRRLNAVRFEIFRILISHNGAIVVVLKASGALQQMIVKILVSLIALAVGGWMIFDGIHVLSTGKYFGPDKPGPWSDLVAAVGIEPFGLGPVFITFGTLWLGFYDGDVT